MIVHTIHQALCTHTILQAYNRLPYVHILYCRHGLYAHSRLPYVRIVYDTHGLYAHGRLQGIGIEMLELE